MTDVSNKIQVAARIEKVSPHLANLLMMMQNADDALALYRDFAVESAKADKAKDETKEKLFGQFGVALCICTLDFDAPVIEKIYDGLVVMKTTYAAQRKYVEALYVKDFVDLYRGPLNKPEPQ